MTPTRIMENYPEMFKDCYQFEVDEAWLPFLDQCFGLLQIYADATKVQTLVESVSEQHGTIRIFYVIRNPLKKSHLFKYAIHDLVRLMELTCVSINNPKE